VPCTLRSSVLISTDSSHNLPSRPRDSLMADTQPTASSSSNFRFVFDNALKAYKKRTKNNILAHPLAAQLQACDSPTAILSFLHQQVQELNQSRESDERLQVARPNSKCVVCLLGDTRRRCCCIITRLIFPLTCLFQVFSPARTIFAGIGVLLLVRISCIPLRRQLKSPNPSGS